MIDIRFDLTSRDLQSAIDRMWKASADKILAIEEAFGPGAGAPVFTVGGRYTSRGWTEWTQGFQFGAALLQFDATREAVFLDIGRTAVRDRMRHHLTHCGVHDHGFNNVSTFGHLLRLAREGRYEAPAWEAAFLEQALCVSGAVQARRWTALPDDLGFVHSFNGPHSLFADTIRSMRSLGVAHLLGHALLDEHDERVSLLQRLVQHARTTAEYNVYYGTGRDFYDVRGRVAHESIFNLNDGRYRCPNTQQGYSPFTTWTRGLSWVMLGFAELLEFIGAVPDEAWDCVMPRAEVRAFMLEAARASCDFFCECTPVDGIPYWDTGAPNLHRLGDYLARPADPFNAWEPVDSSAAAIGCQGLLRLGRVLADDEPPAAERYRQAGLTVLQTLLNEPYVSTDARHQGLLLHSVYHRPNGWDHIPDGRSVPCGEACMWGDYHLREAALLAQRVGDAGGYWTFYE